MAEPGIALDRFVRDNPREAAARLEALLATDRNNAEGWRLLGNALRRLGRADDAAAAETEAVRATAYEPEMIAIARAMTANDLPRAEALLRARLKAQPFCVASIRLMAELAVRVGRPRDCETLLRRALELAPGFAAARANLASLLYRQNRFAEAVAELDVVLDSGEANPASRNLMAVALGRIGDYDEALRLYEQLTPDFPDHPKLWMSYGHILKTVGRQEDSVAAYRRALASKPDFGEVWWSLANLKTVRFGADDVAVMEQALAGELDPDDRLHLHFALGKAYGDAGDAEQSFRHYAAGNALRKAAQDYDPDAVTAQVDGMIATLTPAFLAARAGWGDPAPDPIFILGLPRAGSTLVEQILACHSAIEGTMELPDIPFLAAREARARDLLPRDWPAAAAAMDRSQLAALGAEFLERTRIQRKTGKPFYIDKLPNNWAYAGLIHLILPNAKIVDARRHPLGCCLSGFKQHFAVGQPFTYDLGDVGRYYADYVELMAHFDANLPSRVHRVIYERMVAEPEAEVRRLLDHCGLPFEESCLRFYENDRAVRTASSEQVRQPIFTDAADHWRNFEPWLGPLKAALGPALDAYPAPPVI